MSLWLQICNSGKYSHIFRNFGIFSTNQCYTSALKTVIGVNFPLVSVHGFLLLSCNFATSNFRNKQN